MRFRLFSICPAVFVDGDESRAEQFCSEHGLSLIRIPHPFELNLFYKRDIHELSLQSPDALFFIVYSGHGVQLCPKDKKAGNPVICNFTSGKNHHRSLYGGGSGQLIAKAVGIGDGIRPTVLDATAGMGGDAFVMASLGCQVQLLERSPIVYELLRSGIQQGLLEAEHETSEALGRMRLVSGDSLEWLKRQEPEFVDVVYLDPMFPSREKSALVKKEMQFFHQVVGPDEDADRLLSLARSKAEYRVVVKRGLRSAYLDGIEPTYQLKGKSSRYDVYVNKSLKHHAG